MKKKIKLSDIRQNEIQKDEMQHLVGGEFEQCKFVCSCDCNCTGNQSSLSEQNQNSTKESVRTGGWLKNALNAFSSSEPGFINASGSIIKPGLK